MYLNIIDNLISIETEIRRIKGFYFGSNRNNHEKIQYKNVFHYKVLINNKITIPADYDFRNGHYYKKDNVYYYQRNIGLFTLKFSYDISQRIFSYNKFFSYIPFEIGHIFPPGRHLADLIVFDLFLKGYIFIRGSAALYKNKSLVFIAPSYNGKTSLIKQIIDMGGKYIAEEFFIFSLKSKKIFSTPCLVTDERFINKQLKQKLFQHNIIKGTSHVDTFILYLNQYSTKCQYKNRNFFDFIILRSLFFLKNDFIKSYIFTQNVTSQVFQIINNIKKIKVNYKIKQINNYQFDDILK